MINAVIGASIALALYVPVFVVFCWLLKRDR